MLKDRLKKRVFWTRLLVVLCTVVFVIPAYLFFAPEDIPETSTADSDKKVNTLELEHLSPGTVSAESQQSDILHLPLTSVTVPDKVANRSSDFNKKPEDQDQTLKLLSELLSDYQSPDLAPDQKREISAILPEINQTAEGRNLIATFFFYEQDPEIAAAMYDMILDARLKDPLLISELISRDETQFNDHYKSRLVDLVADHNTVSQTHHQKIEDFLESLALHSDGALRQASVTQWAWYVNQHKGILPVLDAYLFSHSSQVREEVYEMIELDAIQSVSEKREVALALDSLKYADYLALDEQEKARIESLKARLSL